MIYALCSYLIFIALYEHWGNDSVTSTIIYFSVQYLFVAWVALISWLKEKGLPFLFITLIFAGLAINELLYLGFESIQYEQSVNGNTPVYGLTMFAGLIFILHEILTRWKRKSA